MKVQDLLEARQGGWKYNETRVKGALTKVTLALEGSDSGAMTRLAKRYERLDKSAKLLKEKRDQLNAAVKDVGDRVFDAEDTVITRIIETVSYTVMLTAAEKAENKEPTKKTDYESAFSELCRLVPELTSKIDEIRAKYTELIPAKDTPTALKVKPKEVKEGIVDSAKALYFRFLNTIKEWASSYDDKLAAVKAKYPARGGKKAVTEGKSTTDPWAAKMLKTAGISGGSSIDMADTGDGRWVTMAKAEAALEKLVAAGYKKRGKGAWITVTDPETKNGMSFDYDGPEDKRVGLRFFEKE